MSDQKMLGTDQTLTSLTTLNNNYTASEQWLGWRALVHTGVAADNIYQCRWTGSIYEWVLTWTGNDITVSDINFRSGGGLGYGSIYTHDATSDITSVAQNDWDQIVAFSVDGVSNNTTPDHTNNHITVTVAGVYYCGFHWCGNGPAAAHDWDIHIARNNNDSNFDNLTSHQTTPVAQNDESVSSNGIITLAVGDTIEMWVQRTSAGNNIVLRTDSCGVTLIQIGG